MHLFLSREARRELLPESASDRPHEKSREPLSQSFLDARVLAERLGTLMADGASTVSAGDLYGLGRLERGLAAYLERFLSRRGPEGLLAALAVLDHRFGSATVDRLLIAFERDFSPEPTQSLGAVAPAESAGATPAAPAAPAEGIEPSRRRELLAELLIFSIAHTNPAGARVFEWLHSGALIKDPDYGSVIGALHEILDRAPGLHNGDASLIRGLRRPIDASPDSISGQLSWMLENWSDLAPELEPQLVAALDLISEETAPRFPPGAGPPEAPAFDHLDDADVRYGSDRQWMSSLVLAAKNSYVWLHQLSRRHEQKITRLDQIPDAELEKLADSGITGLWLIGIWQRSRASRRIKQLCGNPEALGSAYSVADYRIADELGGDPALDNLSRRAARFGIRLSADMVPNHTAIDSDWLIEHPEYFLSVPVCPFPSYTFNGPDLSPDPRVAIFIEDHYFDRSDAAVVFKRVDKRTGRVRFVYHGNDGTSTPWNDTAQLDYLNPKTRAAVTGTILDVARRFPIIRFDAAMTLAKRHVRRLWHPEPGSAGAIPSRAEHTLSNTKFDSLMPREFWRDVVDRAEQETPDTLLLAEAFWLMEGYFVRNLGLHRVYNSAFMNMLRDRDNRGYRKLIRESLAFDPEILRRYVNFLSNPDERTAIEQFGEGDRYFGACLLLATMPGLPMIAHGQLEGLRERYGMEYRRAYSEETPNRGLLERHERQIFPLLRERRRFADVEGFAMHDFVGSGGKRNENVLAFSHGAGVDTTAGVGTAIIIFNNQPAPARGVLRLDRDVGISGRVGRIATFRDRLSERRFLRASAAIHDQGLELDLAPFESVVLVEFRELADPDGVYTRLRQRLGTRGVPSLEQELHDVSLEDAQTAFVEVLATLSLATPASAPAMLAVETQLEELDRRLQEVLGHEAVTSPVQHDSVASGLDAWLEAISGLAAVEHALDWPRTERMLGAHQRLLAGAEKQPDARFMLSALALLGYVDRRWGDAAAVALEPGRAAHRVLAERNVPQERLDELAALLELVSVGNWMVSQPPPGRAEAERLLSGASGRDDAATLLGYDTEAGTVAVERLDSLFIWRAIAAALSWLAVRSSGVPRGESSADAVVGWCDVLERLRDAVAEADSKLEPVLARLRS